MLVHEQPSLCPSVLHLRREALARGKRRLEYAWSVENEAPGARHTPVSQLWFGCSPPNRAQ